MYLNFTLIEKRGIPLLDVILLMIIKQGKFESVPHEQITGEQLKIFEDNGVVTFIKGSPKDTLSKRARLTPKGEQLLVDIGTVGVLEEDIVLYDWAANIYLKRGKELGSKTLGREYIAKFRANSGISKNNLAKLLGEFINDEAQQTYSQRLEYVFFKPSSMFSSKFDLKHSRLYNYYEARKEHFDSIFETLKQY